MARYSPAVLDALPLAAAEWEALKAAEQRQADQPAVKPEPLPEDVHQLAEAAYRGVSWRKDLEKWRAFVRANGKTISLGVFTDELEAAAAAREGRARLLPYAVD